MSKFPSDEADKFMVRMPAGMRERVAAEAKASGRSMNAEIVHRLQLAYEEIDANNLTLGELAEQWAAENEGKTVVIEVPTEAPPRMMSGSEIKILARELHALMSAEADRPAKVRK